MQQQTVMLNKAKISRPRPGSWSRGRDRGLGFEVKVEAIFWGRGQSRGQQ